MIEKFELKTYQKGGANLEFLLQHDPFPKEI